MSGPNIEELRAWPTESVVLVDYTNWRGERRRRRIRPVRIFFGSTQWHPERQWLLSAIDMEDEGALKEFAMSGIHAWEVCDVAV